MQNPAAITLIRINSVASLHLVALLYRLTYSKINPPNSKPSTVSRSQIRPHHSVPIPKIPYGRNFEHDYPRPNLLNDGVAHRTLHRLRRHRLPFPKAVGADNMPTGQHLELLERFVGISFL